MVIACEAGQAEVVGPSDTTVAAGNDVVYLKCEIVELLRNLAVFTASAGTLPNELL
jgi:hypothetical protein